MDRSDCIDYTFYGSGEAFAGIVHSETDIVKRFIKAPFKFYKGLLWQPAAIRAVCRGGYDAVIFLADPNFASTWIAALLARSRGVRVLFWGHGWLKDESRFKSRARLAYFNIANRFLTYSEGAKRRGVSAGYAERKIAVVYNSLDVERATGVIARIKSGELTSVVPQNFFGEPERPLIVCTARLTDKCRFDLLLEAAALLDEGGPSINVLLVGDGPKRSELEKRAQKLGIAAHFFGSCYDEEITGQLIYHSDLTVSPGKIGLTAMHSLMYGTPAITHDNSDEQMPEVEAIEPGETGFFFRQNDARSLAKTIAEWLKSDRDRDCVRAACHTVIARKWNPNTQAQLIERAVLDVSHRG
jgi:glycosyltransferase involved in cell wall biosynthesis